MKIPEKMQRKAKRKAWPGETSAGVCLDTEWHCLLPSLWQVDWFICSWRVVPWVHDNDMLLFGPSVCYEHSLSGTREWV